MRSHEWIDRRSAALHEAVAAKIEQRPDLLNVARTNLSRWLRESRSQALLEWQQILDGSSVSDVVALLRATTPTADRLRQSSPFAGVLTRAERDAILERYDPRRA